MTWQTHDNPNVRGPVDRVFVSQTEYWEVHYFVDHYLSTHNYTLSDANRQIVHDTMKQYPGRAPIKREDLTNFLNQQFKK